MAVLKPVQLEVGGGGTYRWVDGYQVISPDGKEMFPYMQKREAKRFCYAQGWLPRKEQ